MNETPSSNLSTESATAFWPGRSSFARVVRDKRLHLTTCRRGGCARQPPRKRHWLNNVMLLRTMATADVIAGLEAEYQSRRAHRMSLRWRPGYTGRGSVRTASRTLRAGTVRFLVPAGTDPGRVRPIPRPEAVAGDDDSLGLFTNGTRNSHPVARGPGLVLRLVRPTEPGLWCPESAGLGRRTRGRSVASPKSRPHRRLPRVPRNAGRESRDPQTHRPRGQSHAQTVDSALPQRLLASGSQHPARGFFVKANASMRVLGCAPNDQITADQAAMMALPSVTQQVGWRRPQRLPRDASRGDRSPYRHPR